ncbi:metallophosphoesterase [Aquimarina intermedia]|uniref:Calcineurin-like phosphoesterase family protein n=1 Tax=Aquimarina intermedia TaxID=350814 RepID=A0A5S5BUL3_9FLAO|nr:metallophosphoesterase [Aquimarina intermedia]TYP70006.1 calcineurin-like phosphoesterase family protein [Aquimarina intermedia]
MKKYNIILTILSFLLLSNCALYEPQYRDKKTSYTVTNADQIEKTFYLIGDAGYASLGESTPGLLAFEKYLKAHSQQGNYAIFLGDNIYPDGMPEKDAVDRPLAEHRLDAQIESVNSFDGQVIFIPGNHDWYNEGLKGLKREENYFESKLKDRKVFRPAKGCPIETIDITDNIQLILVDSQWYLEDWDKHPTINDNCPQIKSRETFFLEFQSALKKGQDKTNLIALHHPLFSNGVHGGKYAPVKHLYPSQRKIPLPVLGSLAMMIRTSGGVSSQDIQNKQYKSLVRRMSTIASGGERVIFASGHEHSIQYIVNDSIKQIVSGSGAKASYATLANDGIFAYGGQGFVRLDILKDGSSRASYFGSENNEPVLLFETEVHPKRKDYDFSSLPDSFDQTVEASVYDYEETDRTEVYESIWGDHYRDLYGKKIQAPVADLDTLYGGLTVIRKGGGQQTRSLRVKDKDGKEFNLRALRKSGVQFLQANAFKNNYVADDLENTISEDILQDFYTAAHPYIFTVIPDLSDAVGIYHTNPKVFYVPKQKTLGKYNAEYGDELYMIEERPEEHHVNQITFGQPDDIESTADVYERLRRDEKYKIDEAAFIRARMFDMLIGDWDRHQDQWRWAEFEKENGDHIFRPIPRDRDQAFSNFDGAFLGTLRGLIGVTNKFQVYDKTLKSIKWFNIAGLKLDRTFIQSSGKDEWKKQAKFIQDNLTDEVIETAFTKLPDAVKGDSSNEIKAKLKGRRDNLVKIAERYYKYLAELAIVTGTDKDDYIEVERMENGKTKITISRIKGGEKADVVSEKLYDRKNTKEIWLYGLDDDDYFNVRGKGDNPIYIRIIGGQDHDKFNIEKGRRVTIYDYKSKPNTIIRKGNAKVRFTDTYEVNSFDKNKEIVTKNSLIPAVAYNPDDGFKIGVKNVYRVNGFNRNPFTSKHTLTAGFYFATNGFDVKYKGEFAGVLKNFNLMVGAKFTSPNFSENFFGFGNETVNNDDDLGLDFNRVRISHIGVDIGAAKFGRFGSYFDYKARFEGIQVDKDGDRFIGNPVFESGDPEFFKRKYFVSADATYRYESYDVDVNPTNGMKFEINGGITANAEDFDRTFGYINPYLGFYNSLITSRKLVLKTSAQAQINLGDDYEFYQSAQLGQNTGLRGYRNQRFSGKRSFATSADLRYSFNQFKTGVLPIQIGIFGGFDLGRVWLSDNDNSTLWHNNYGGGFWINSADSLSGTFNFFTGEDGLRFSFGFGFTF